MFADHGPYGWLVHSALMSLIVLSIGSGAVLLSGQPIRRLRIIELTLLGCLVAPWLGMVPGYPQLIRVGSSDVAAVDRQEAASLPSAATTVPRRDPRHDSLPPAFEGIPSGRSAAADVTPARAMDVISWLIAVYFLGVAFGFGWWLLGVAALARIIRAASPAAPRCRELLAEIAGERGNQVRVLMSRRVKTALRVCLGASRDHPARELMWRRAGTSMVVGSRMVARGASRLPGMAHGGLGPFAVLLPAAGVVAAAAASALPGLSCRRPGSASRLRRKIMPSFSPRALPRHRCGPHRLVWAWVFTNRSFTGG